MLSLLRLGSDRVGAPVGAPPSISPGVAADPTLVQDLRAALPPWLVARLLVAATLVAAKAIAAAVGQPAPERVTHHLAEGLLGWDAERYLQIAAEGYGRLPRIELRFFPLQPLLVRWLDPLLPGGKAAVALVVANGAALAFGVLLHRLALAETGDAAVARRAAWFAACFPTAFVLVWGYTEALFLALGTAAFVAIRNRSWWWAAAAAGAVGLLRPVGLLIAPAIALEVFFLWRSGARLAARHFAAVLAAPAAASAYLGWVGWRFGNPLLPFTIQQTPEFRGAPIDPVRAWWRTAELLARGQVTPESLRAVWVLVLAALVVVCWRRWRPSYALYATLVVLVAASTSRLGSFERYGFTAFPVLLALATVPTRRVIAWALVAGGAAAMTLFGTLALIGAYIP